MSAPRKFTRAEVEDIRRRHAEGVTQISLAEEYDTSWSAIAQITRGESYADWGGPITIRERTLSPRDVEEIRHAAAKGVAKLALASEYGVSRSLVRRIVSGAIYADCEGPTEQTV